MYKSTISLKKCIKYIRKNVNISHIKTIRKIENMYTHIKKIIISH